MPPVASLPTSNLKALAKVYVKSNIGLLSLYSKAQLKSLIQTLTIAQEGASFTNKASLVKETQQLIAQWDWTDLPESLSGNNKVVVLKRLQVEKTKLASFTRLYKLISGENVTAMDLKNFVKKAEAAEVSSEAIGEISDEDIDTQAEGEGDIDLEDDVYFLIDSDGISCYQASSIAIEICNESDYSMLIYSIGKYILITDNDSLNEPEDQVETRVLEIINQIISNDEVITKEVFASEEATTEETESEETEKEPNTPT